MPTVLFTLKQYLAEQAALAERTGVKKDIPSQAELADLVGRHEVTFSRMMNNKSDTINLSTLATIIKDLRRRGFNPAFDDLFSYHE